jgi:hypothetical protein
MFVGEKLLVDLGASQEVVAIQTILSGNRITGTFANTHTSTTASPVLVSIVGIFPQGVLSTSTASQLQLIGDINSDGNLYYVVYNCDAASGTLTRSITQLPATTASAADILVQNVIANPGGTLCNIFTYATPVTVAVAGNNYTFIPSVGVTLTTQSAQPDPQTNQYAQMTKSFLNICPRNVLFGLNLANGGTADRLQPLPPQGTYRP